DDAGADDYCFDFIHGATLFSAPPRRQRVLARRPRCVSAAQPTGPIRRRNPAARPADREFPSGPNSR
ncbi:MAG: hypothetical protein AAF360_18470, partial [Pseudomonadota bacterium]